MSLSRSGLPFGQGTLASKTFHKYKYKAVATFQSGCPETGKPLAQQDSLHTHLSSPPSNHTPCSVAESGLFKDLSTLSPVQSTSAVDAQRPPATPIAGVLRQGTAQACVPR